MTDSVLLRQTPADQLASVIDQSFDTVISNSVIQYFPTIDYLVQVVKTAVDFVTPGGQIFLGDILSLPLLEAFHTSVQLAQAPGSLTVDQLRQRIGDRLHREQRLIIDPEFFIALKEDVPRISHVDIQLKRGHYQNELTCFRYDVVLHIEKPAALPTQPPMYLDWQQEPLTPTIVRKHLLEQSPELLIVTHVPNARVWADVQATDWLARPDCPERVGDLRLQIDPDGMDPNGIEPEDWWQWQVDLPYRITIDWSGNGADGYYDVIFVRSGTSIIPDRAMRSKHKTPRQPWSAYANQPYTGTAHRHLVPQLREFLTQKLPGYMIPSAFVFLDQFPLTPNGKVDRKALPAPDKSRPMLDVELVAPRTATEEKLTELWADVLSLNEIGVLDNFFMLGGDSIQATQLTSRVRDVFQIELSLHRLFEWPTIAQLGEYISGLSDPHRQSSPSLSPQHLAPIQPVPHVGDLPLSFAEQRLWFLDQLQGDGEQGNRVVYNEQDALSLSGAVHIESLRAAIQDIVGRHESLRTNYQAIDGSPIRVIHPTLELDIPIVDIQQTSKAQQVSEVQFLARKERQQPFDLAHDPLLRVMLVQLAPDEYVLLLTMHHIVTDGWSTSVLGSELEILYRTYLEGRSSPLSPLPIQYTDFASWQRQPQIVDTLAPQLAYWQNQLSGVLPLLEIPTDHPRPMLQSYTGKRVFFELGPRLTNDLKRLSHRSESTLFMTLLAAFNVLLYRYSHQTDWWWALRLRIAIAAKLKG